MDLKEYSLSAPKRHPWEICRVEVLRNILQKFLKTGDLIRVLDIGCGDGYTIAELFKEKQVYIDAVDSNLTEQQAELFSRKYKTIRFYSNLDRLPKENYDIITMLDVIEHVEDDRSFLETVSSYAKPKAILVLTAPAFNSLLSKHDIFLKHYRRYSDLQLRQLVQQTGFSVEASGYLFFSLLVVRFLAIIYDKLVSQFIIRGEHTGVANWNFSKKITYIVVTALKLENSITLWLNHRKVKIPGLSVWTVCIKSQ